MKTLLVGALCLLVLCSCTPKQEQTLVIYGYDSLQWITDSLTEQFAEAHNCTVRFVPFESTAQMVTRLILEKSAPEADVAIGFTPTMLAQAKKEEIIRPYTSKNLDALTDTGFIFDAQHYTTPYDYGSLAVIYKPDMFEEAPSTFDDLPGRSDGVIIQDPRTSSTGTDFLLWTIAVYGDNWTEYWKKLKDAVMTVSPGWSESFAAFENSDAAMMISYATDSAYAVHNYGESTYRAFIPESGGYIQIEGASVVRDCSNPDLAEKFIDFMLTESFQSEIPLNQWMFPVTDVPLPEVFTHAIVPDKTVTLESSTIEANLEAWLSDWEDIMTR